MTEPNDTVILAHEKHGTAVYSSALTLLAERVREDIYYEEADLQAAAMILRMANNDVTRPAAERHAWRFLAARSDYQYEGVEKVVAR